MGASLVPETVKNPPAMQETWVLSLGGEDSLEKGMATHSSILAWRIPWTEELGRLQSSRVENSWTRLSNQHFHFHFTFTIGSGNPLQYSCLENPWTEKLSGLQLMGSQRVRHNWANKYFDIVKCKTYYVLRAMWENWSTARYRSQKWLFKCKTDREVKYIWFELEMIISFQGSASKGPSAWPCKKKKSVSQPQLYIITFIYDTEITSIIWNVNFF